MYNSREREPKGKNRFWPGYFIGYGVGILLFQVPDFMHTDQEKAEEAQEYNKQLTSQIQARTDNTADEIVVHTSDKTVTFALPSEGSGERSCESDYKTDASVAKLSGQIVCEVTFK